MINPDWTFETMTGGPDLGVAPNGPSCARRGA